LSYFIYLFIYESYFDALDIGDFGRSWYCSWTGSAPMEPYDDKFKIVSEFFKVCPVVDYVIIYELVRILTVWNSFRLVDSQNLIWIHSTIS